MEESSAFNRHSASVHHPPSPPPPPPPDGAISTSVRGGNKATWQLPRPRLTADEPTCC